MALVKKSTWRQMRHNASLWARDLSDGISRSLQFDGINGGINESMREDIPWDETEEERLDREQREQEDRDLEEQEMQDEIDRQREEDERAWQEEQDRLLEKESREPGAWQQAWDRFQESSFYQGYRNTRNALVGGAVMSAGLGLTSGGVGLAITAAPGALYVGKELKGWIDDKLEAGREWQAAREAEKAKEGAVELTPEEEALSSYVDGYVDRHGHGRELDEWQIQALRRRGMEEAVNAGIGPKELLDSAGLAAAAHHQGDGRDVRSALSDYQSALHETEEKLRKAEAQAAAGVAEDQRQKAEPGSVAYNNIKAKERTVDQKIQEQEALLDGMSAKPVDPAFVQASSEALVANLRQAETPGFQLGRM